MTSTKQMDLLYLSVIYADHRWVQITENKIKPLEENTLGLVITSTIGRELARTLKLFFHHLLTISPSHKYNNTFSVHRDENNQTKKSHLRSEEASHQVLLSSGANHCHADHWHNLSPNRSPLEKCLHLAGDFKYVLTYKYP